MANIPSIGQAEWAASQATPWVQVNLALRALAAYGIGLILQSRSLAAPPAAPADGDCYRLSGAGSGAWSGLVTGDVAVALGANASNGWAVIPKAYVERTGVKIFILDEGLSSRFWGTWRDGQDVFVDMTGAADGDAVVWDASNGVFYLAPPGDLDPYPPAVPGHWIVPFECVVAAGTAGSANTIRFVPWVQRVPISVQALAARVTTVLNGGKFQLGLYAHDRTLGEPTGNVLCNTGDLSTTNLGPVSGAVTQTYLPPGTYWAGINQDNGTAIYTVPASTVAHFSSLIGSATIANVLSTAAAASLKYTIAQSYGTWPNLTGASLAESTAQAGALVLLQAA